MADQAPKKGLLSRAKALFGRAETDIQQGNGVEDYGYDAVSVSTLLGSGKRQARSRSQLYQKYHYMAGDPVISAALRLHVTASLGGHETTGDTIFIEDLPPKEVDGKAQPVNKEHARIVAELKTDLLPLFNKVAHQMAYNGAAFGDAYARPYLKEKVGLVDLYTEELVYPPLVQPYERANKTVGYVVSTGEKMVERLTIKQLLRVKMPRLLYVAQHRVIEKAAKIALKEDDIEALPILPSLVGGSFLDSAEEPYDNLISAITGMVGQRLLNSIDENLVSANTDGMSKERRKEFMDSLRSMLTASKKRAEQAIKENRPVTERIYHIIPTSGDKQVTQISQFNGTSGSSSISVEDILFHAKMLAGTLGIDLSMLGFADLLSGGLGDGGFFRMSAQGAERARIIRTGLQQFYNDCIDLHTLYKYGWVFDEGDRPYVINFYGSISALENEKAASSEKKMNAGAMLVQTLDALKTLGLPEDVIDQLLEKEFGMDDSMAKIIAAGLVKAAKAAAEAEAKANGGGGFGGAGGGGFEDDDLNPDLDVVPPKKPEVNLGGSDENDE